MENKNRGLGLMGVFQGKENWYGGQIQQIGHVVECGERGIYKVIIQPLTQTRSTRFARFLGSRRLFQLRVSDRLAQNDKVGINEFLSQKFVLCGRVFVPWVAKEGSLYLVECEENYARESCEWCGDQFRKTYASILEWHNPPQGNDSQVRMLLTSFVCLILTIILAASKVRDEECAGFIDLRSGLGL